MDLHTALRSLLGASLSALLFTAAVGCNPIVSVGGGAGDDTGGHSGTGGKVGTGGGGAGAGGDIGGTGGVGGGTDVPPGTGGGGNGGTAKVYDAFSYEFATNAGGFGEGGGGVGGGGNPDGPTGEYLVYGSGFGIPTCNHAFGSGACGGWTVVLHLDDEALLTPGTLNIGDPGLDIYFSESSDNGMPDSCSGGGGGGFKQGQLEILDVSQNQVHFKVSGVSLLDFDGNGEFTADRCMVQY
jgi:hypothetical protein